MATTCQLLVSTNLLTPSKVTFCFPRLQNSSLVSEVQLNCQQGNTQNPGVDYTVLGLRNNKREAGERYKSETGPSQALCKTPCYNTYEFL